MGKFLQSARSHADKIDHYYQHATHTGYDQAMYHVDELAALYSRASNSKNDKNDAIQIYKILNSKNDMMREMKDRKDARPA